MFNKFEEIQMLKVPPVTDRKTGSASPQGKISAVGRFFGKLAFPEMASTLFWKRS